MRKGATGRPCRSAGFQPAVSRISNPRVCCQRNPVFGVRPQPAGSRRYSRLVTCATPARRFHPVRSDPIRPDPGESGRMKAVGDCNCTIAGAARWIATSGRDGRRQEKKARLKSETPGSSTVLSLLNDYRARRSRSTSLPDRIGRLNERRKAVFDARIRLFADFQRFLQPVHVVLSPHAVSKSRCRKRFCRQERTCKTKPNGGRVQNRKTSFFRRNTNFLISSNLHEKTCFCETNPNREKRGSAATDCNPAGYLRTLWRRLTVAGAKRTQMKPWKERSGRGSVATEPSPPETRERHVAETVRVRGRGDCMDTVQAKGFCLDGPGQRRILAALAAPERTSTEERP